MINGRQRTLSRLVLPLVCFMVVYVFVRHMPGYPAQSVHPFFESSFDVAAHGGGMAEHPENSNHAFAHANRLGVDVLELDVHLTRDGHLVVIHDETLDRTTNGNGLVRDFELADLQRLDAGYWATKSTVKATVADHLETYPYRNKGYRLVSLADLFVAYGKRRFIVEIKPDSESAADALCQLIRSYGLETRVMVGSFYAKPLNRFRLQCPGVATTMSQAEVMRFFIAQKVGVSHFLAPNAQALVVPRQFRGITVVDDAFLETAHQRGLRVYVWTVNGEHEMKRLMALGVDGLVTDYPSRLLKLLKTQ